MISQSRKDCLSRHSTAKEPQGELSSRTRENSLLSRLDQAVAETQARTPGQRRESVVVHLTKTCTKDAEAVTSLRKRMLEVEETAQRGAWACEGRRSERIVRWF